jgi:hypothetical protein
VTEVALLARIYSVEAIQTLATLMLDPEVKPRDRAYAADIILERGLGRPLAVVKLEGDDDPVREGMREPGEAAVADGDRMRQIVQILADAGALDLVINPALKATPGAVLDDEPITSTAVPV